MLAWRDLQPGDQSIASVPPAEEGANIARTFSTTSGAEKAYLVGVDAREDDNRWPASSSLDELGHLTHAAGAEVVGRLTQKLLRPSPTHYLGDGKLRELAGLRAVLGYEVVIFDDELQPRQQRNLEEALKVKVIDRTALILDIFGRRAQTREGQIQVELAQHKYLLPRLAGQWSHLERLGGGIGTRGPGESQLETDRRLIHDRIRRLEDRLEGVRRHRALYQGRRRRAGIPVVALVGYTNAGKSTVLNALGQADVPVRHTLFSTLDPVTRRVMLPDGQPCLLTDTVGFIQKLPPAVVAAFRATLEELEHASLLLHVIDITHPEASRQCQAVESILSTLHLSAKPRLLVVNKLDRVLATEDQMKAHGAEALASRFTEADGAPAVLISAARGWGLDDLARGIATMLTARADGVNSGLREGATTMGQAFPTRRRPRQIPVL